MALNEEELIAYDQYEGDEPGFDHVDDFRVENVSDPEESWGDEEPSHESDYSFISDEEEVRCGWIDTSLPVMKKHNSNDSQWEVVSVASVISLSDCSINDVARGIVEREQDLSGMTEPVIDEKDYVEPEFALNQESKKDQKKKKKNKAKKNIKFGIILFRKNGGEIALTRKVGGNRKGKYPLSLPRSSMKQHESPLDAAVRCFVEDSGCTNFDRFAALPSLIERKMGKKVYLFFPTVVNCNLRFLSNAKSNVEWYPTDIVCRKMKHIDQDISAVVQEATHMLEIHAPSIPTLVDPETEELADMAHRDLLDFALNKKVSVTSSEVRDFLARNEEDLKKMFEGPSREEMSAMLRKLVMQLPVVHKEPKKENIPLSSVQALQMLQTFVAAHTNNKGKVKWRRVNDMLFENVGVLVDEHVQSVLLQCRWNPETQKFSKEGKEQRHAAYLTAMDAFSLVRTSI